MNNKQKTALPFECLACGSFPTTYIVRAGDEVYFYLSTHKDDFTGMTCCYSNMAI